MSYQHRRVMIEAWKIARKGAQQFGGCVRAYLAEALRQAWQEIKDSPWAQAFVKVFADLEKQGIGMKELKAMVASNRNRGMEGSCHWIGR